MDYRMKQEIKREIELALDDVKAMVPIEVSRCLAGLGFLESKSSEPPVVEKKRIRRSRGKKE